MSGSRHKVRLLTPKIGQRLWLIMYTVNCYKFVVTDSNNRPVSFDQQEMTHESISQSAARDSNGWRDCFHNYYEGDITLVPTISNNPFIPVTEQTWRPDDRFRNYKMTGFKFWVGNEFNTIVLSETYDAYYSWNTGTWMNQMGVRTTNQGNAFSRSYKIVSNDPKSTYWPPGMQTETMEFIFDETRFSQLAHCGHVGVIVNTSTINKLGKKNSTYSTSANSFLLGTITDQVDETLLPNLQTSAAISLEDPESFTSDLIAKLPVAQANSYNNIKELKEWRQLVPPIKSLIAKHNIKSLADLYLWWKYSYSTTKMDLEEYFRVFNEINKHYSSEQKQQTLSLSYAQNGGILRYNILVDSFLEPIWNAMGFEFNLGNVWDAIPFSFVLDWFVKVGTTLSSIDAVSTAKNLKYSGVYRSFSRKEVVNTTLPNVTVKVKKNLYTRERLQSLPMNVVGLHLGNPSAHLLDGSSLYLANRR